MNANVATRAGRAGALLCCCWLVLSGAAARAADATADPLRARGEHIARLVCAACHVVASDQEFPPLLEQPTPSLGDIANRPDASASSIRRFIGTTHWDDKSVPMKMPKLMLTGEQITAVTRYILSLRRH